MGDGGLCFMEVKGCMNIKWVGLAAMKWMVNKTWEEHGESGRETKPVQFALNEFNAHIVILMI